MGKGDVESQLGCGFDEAAVEIGDRIPEFGPLLNAAGFHEFAVALGGEASTLNLVIWTVVIAEDLVPDPAAAGGSPTPYFFARVLAEIGYVDDAVVRLVVVDAEKVAMDIPGEDGHGAGNVPVPTLIDAFPDRPALDDGEWIVIDGLAHGVDVLEVIGGRDRGVGPEEVELIESGCVEERDALFEPGGIGPQGERDLPIHIGDPVDGTDKSRSAAVGILMQSGLDFRHCVRRVREGKAELYATRDPRPAWANQTILDDVVAVEHLAAMDLVIDGVDVSSEFREDDDLEVLVFEIDGAPGPGPALIAEVVEHRVGIDGMRIDQGKGRIRIGRSERIGGDGDGAFPSAHRLRMGGERGKEKGERNGKEAIHRGDIRGTSVCQCGDQRCNDDRINS